MRIAITNEMKERAWEEAKRRKPHLHERHFAAGTEEERDIMGFCGEFACSQMLLGNWEMFIRDGYETIDDHDIIYKGNKIDVKTESLPSNLLKKVWTHNIQDDLPYGRRLICGAQANLLPKYDLIVFGAVERGNLDFWYAVGYISTEHIITNYKPTTDTPYGKEYIVAGYPVKNSELHDIKDLIL